MDGPGQLLSVTDLHAGYGKAEVLHGIGLRAEAGQVITVIGPNGAGKSTLLNALIGALPARGEIAFLGRAIGGLELEERVMRGLALVPEKRALFGTMAVEDNLLLGAYRQVRLGHRDTAAAMERVFGLFPRLKERATQLAGTMSGGEQQMLAMGRALMARPTVLLMDEPSMGLSPIMVDKIFEVVGNIHQQGTTILLVEQNASRALSLADRGYVMDSGEITMAGEAKQLLADPRVRAAYLGE
jgi:branched-chain amino acid transport system ATP-binding protein